MTGVALRGGRTATAMSAVLLAGAVLVSGLSACGSPRSAAARTAQGGGQQDAWQRMTGQAGPDGRLDLASSLAAFVLAVGPVTGVAKPSAAAAPIATATLAVTSVLAHWSELTADQRSAVVADLGGTAGANAPAGYGYAIAPRQAPATADPDVPCLTADSAGAGPYRAQLAGIESAITAHLGRPLAIADHVFLSVNTRDLENAMMYSWACAGAKTATGTVTGCTVHINPKTVAGHFSDAEMRSFLVHELMHCYLFDKFGMSYDHMPAWYVEGVPTWVMSELGTGSARLGSIWKSYLDTPGRPLSQRTYDGLGFFTHLAETGTNVWKAIDPIGAAMLGGADATAAGWTAAGVTGSFLDSWGSGFVQGRYPGAPWTSHGPNLPPYRPALGNARIGDGGTLTVTAAAFAATIDQVDVDAGVLLIEPGADTTGRLTVGGGADARLTDSPLCTIANCGCPQGSPGAGTEFRKMSPGAQYLGVTGGAKGGTVTLTGQSLPDFCAKPAHACLVGQWTSVGFDVAAGSMITEHGGSGVRMHIDPRGDATVVFDGMSPVTFTASTSGTPTAGRFTFAGTVAGAIVVPNGSAKSGPWHQARPSTGSITADIQLTSPFSYHMGPLDVGSLAGAVGGAGGAVGKPELTDGTWTCSGDTLVSTPPAGGKVTGTWTLTRTGPG